MPLEIPDHFLRLGSHAEKQYFLEDQELYDGAIFNANLVAITTAACASLATALQEEEMPLLIDPWTFVFGLESSYLMVERTKDGEKYIDVKSSYAELAKIYGDPIRSLVASQDWQNNREARLRPNAFSDAQVQSFTDNVLRFQRFALQDEMAEDEYFGPAGVIEPDVLIAPYFFIDPEEPQPWLELNLSLLDAALESNIAEGLPVVPIVCLGQRSVHQLQWQTLDNWLERYRRRGCEGYFLWISDFDETEVPTPVLRGFLHAVDVLSGDGDATVMNMFGGYFSVTSLQFGLGAFSHSVGYGESKNVIPPSGGVPVAKYYFPPLHKRIEAEDALEMVSRLSREDLGEFYEYICECVVCERRVEDGIEGFAAFAEAEKSDKEDLPEWLKDRKYPTGEAKRLNNEHYLRARQAELREIREAEAGSIPELIGEDLAWYQEHFAAPLFPTARHLHRWREALQGGLV